MEKETTFPGVLRFHGIEAKTSGGGGGARGRDTFQGKSFEGKG